MELNDFYRRFSSDCTAGSADQVLTRYDAPVTVTGRCPYRLERGGENYSLLFGNSADSTYADGSVSRACDPGGTWTILSMRAGLAPSAYDEPEAWLEVSFGGAGTKTVAPREVFCCDPLPLKASGGEYLIYEITLSGSCYPYHEEIVLPVTVKGSDGIFRPGKKIPVPLMIGCDRPVSRRVGFIGDSITQGCGTEVNSYTHWVAKIAEKLPPDISVWDLGIGYARAYDAAADSDWLARAKRCDTVNVCFGVNDLLRGRTADQVKGDLHTIVRSLKAAGCRVILFTVPPFDMTGDAMRYLYDVNAAVRGSLGAEADGIFDFAAVLGRPEPDAHMSVYGGHPNAEGCAVLAKAYIEAGMI